MSLDIVRSKRVRHNSHPPVRHFGATEHTIYIRRDADENRRE